ncbi:YqgE/AlgH family protein [Tessaracoccus terricola]
MRTGSPPAAGQVLIATEPGKGGYFDRSVVLLLDHNESGSLGVCLHKVAELEMVEPLAHFTQYLSPPVTLFEGGPVSQQAAVSLAKVANPWEEPPGWRRVFDDVGILDLETPIELVAGAFSHLRIFVGLAGWDAGQLEAELIRGSWFRAPARVEEIFGTPEDLWRRSLRRMGGATGRWSTWTETPELN